MTKFWGGAKNGYHYCDAYRVWVYAYPEVTPVFGLSWLKACFLEYYKLNMPVFHICPHSPNIKLVSNYENTNSKFASEIRQYEDLRPKTNLLQYIFFNWEIVKVGITRYAGGVSVSEPNYF